MIPITLIIQSFGPYKECETIKFSEFLEDKIFLITGNTGSGKTMIFDALCYALFGESSSKDRDSSSFVSQFSDNTKLTYVELEFHHRQKKYFVRREPEQIKISRNKEVNHKPFAELRFDDEVITGIKNVNLKIRDILGIDYLQFKQIVMIAQGEFRKLISADSRDREVIYRKIFDTHMFEKIQNSLKDKTSELFNDIKNVNENIKGILISLKDIVQISFDDNTFENIITILKEEEGKRKLLIDEISSKKNDIEARIKEKTSLFERIKELKNYIEEFEKLDVESLKKESSYLNLANKSFKILGYEKSFLEGIKSLEFELKEKKEFLNKLKDVEINFKLIKGKLDFEKTNDNYREELKLKISHLESLSGLIKENEILSSNILDFENKLNMQNKEKQDKLNLKNSILLELDEINNFEKDNLRIDEELFSYKQDKNKILNIKSLVERYREELKLYNDSKTNHDIYEEKYKVLYEDYEKKNLELLDMEDKYFKNQAGILAKKLKQNNPCMVCGSLNHPNKAKLINEDIDEDSIRKFKKEVEICKRDLDEIKETLLLNKNVKTLKEDIVRNIYDEIKSTDGISFDDFYLFSDFDFREIDLNLFRIDEKIEKLENIKEKILSLSIKKNDLNVKIEETNKSIEEIDKRVHTYSCELLSFKIRLEEKSLELSKYDINSLEEYNNTLNDFKMKYEISSNNLKVLEDEFTSCSDKKLEYDLKVEDKQKNISRLESLNDIKEEEFLLKLKEYGFKDKSEYENFKISEQEYERRIRVLDEKRDSYKFLNSNINKLKGELKDIYLSEDEIKIEIDSLEKKLNDINNEDKKLIGILSSLQNAIDNIERLCANISKNEMYRTNVNELNKISNGINRDKISFERYVLSIYFKDIISSANVRFSKITNGKYILKHSKDRLDGRSQQGLDISVFDNHTGKERHVSTLSGGESFKASLCLALALSDVIQKHAGGISIDTLFIDEGFGSLDSESLNVALECLISESCESKLIGIISHVRELKEFIPSKICVVDSNSGSKIFLKKK